MPYKRDPVKNRAYQLEYQRKWRAKYPEKVKAINAKHYTNNHEYIIKRDAETRERKRLEWAGRPRSANCEICNKKCRTVLDHDHATGKFRGWICNHCNTSLGFARDHIEVFYKMIDYLNRSRGLMVINQQELLKEQPNITT